MGICNLFFHCCINAEVAMILFLLMLDKMLVKQKVAVN